MKIIRPVGATIELTKEEKETLARSGEILYNLITYHLPFDLQTLTSEDGMFSKFEIQKISRFLCEFSNGAYSLE